MINPEYMEATNEQLGHSEWFDLYEDPSEWYVNWISIHDMGDGSFVRYTEDNYGHRTYRASCFGPVIQRWRDEIAYRYAEDEEAERREQECAAAWSERTAGYPTIQEEE